MPEILRIIETSELDEDLKAQACEVFTRIGKAEAAIHGMPLEKVHLHEVGGVDTIVDVVGSLAGIRLLGIGRVVCSPLPNGRGFVEGAHGQIPLPAPATAALLQGIPQYGIGVDAELVTPTGAALLAFLASEFGPMPAIEVAAIGYGAGTRDLAIPNVLRVFIGESAAEVPCELLVQLEANIDDANPQIYDHVMARLFAAGALDVWLTPCQMKKNRPGIALGCLCRAKDAAALREIIFRETPTLGIRESEVRRFALEREETEVETPFGPLKAKRAFLAGEAMRTVPEYDDARRLAEAAGVPLAEIYRSIELAL